MASWIIGSGTAGFATHHIACPGFLFAGGGGPDGGGKTTGGKKIGGVGGKLVLGGLGP